MKLLKKDKIINEKVNIDLSKKYSIKLNFIENFNS